MSNTIKPREILYQYFNEKSLSLMWKNLKWNKNQEKTRHENFNDVQINHSNIKTTQFHKEQYLWVNTKTKDHNNKTREKIRYYSLLVWLKTTMKEKTKLRSIDNFWEHTLLRSLSHLSALPLQSPHTLLLPLNKSKKF
jgi:hypothetical protein